MVLFERPFVAFDGYCYKMEETMMFVRAMIDTESIEQDVYEGIMSRLIELKSGYPYDSDDMINNPNGGYMTLLCFFRDYGYAVRGASRFPLPVHEEGDEEEKKDEETNIINDDLISDVTTLTELEAIDLMNDDIGDILDNINPTVERFTW